ncbi:UNVERIFIED_CONTAM: Casparian strip membrane protein 3 [Sesamum latifolium]|uniref:CASP-like protein n=1 Tax=Sesamum latifolium TaxID=2727402 RepID=A0AAW2Y830_9LAMI
MVGVEVDAKESGSGQKRSGVSRGVAVLDFILRLVAIVATLASAIAMGTTNESLPLFYSVHSVQGQIQRSPHFHFKFSCSFFVVANSIVSAYLILSLAFSIFHIIRSGGAQKSRVVLIFFDTGMLALLTAAASAAAAIVYLAHKGNTRTNWFAICQQYNSFCERISGSLIGSFGGIIVLILLILISATTLSRR